MTAELEPCLRVLFPQVSPFPKVGERAIILFNGLWIRPKEIRYDPYFAVLRTPEGDISAEAVMGWRCDIEMKDGTVRRIDNAQTSLMRHRSGRTILSIY